MKRLALVLILASICPAVWAADPYWVSATGAAANWAACQSATALAGAAACTLAQANANAIPGDTIYLRAGTYSVTTNGIAPVNSGTNGNVITFSGYASETITISGAAGDAAYASEGITLSAKQYIKVTKMTFTNLRTWFTFTGGGYHEISNNIFESQRSSWSEKIYQSGTATADDATGATLTHAETAGTYVGYFLYNKTDKSACQIRDTSTTTTKTCTTLSNGRLNFGTDNQWSIGDEYEIHLAMSAAYGVGYIKNSSVHNWIHNNVFHGAGAFSWDDEGSCLHVGIENSTTDASNYNTIEDNEFYAGAHHVLGVNAGLYNVVRNNYIHNEAWFATAGIFANGQACQQYASGECGYRVMSSVANSVGGVDYGGHSLYEDNKIAYGAMGGGNLNSGNSGSGSTLATPYNIYRYNKHYGNNLYGLRVQASISTLPQGNRIYNNTFYRNGWGATEEAALESLPTGYRNGLYLPSISTCADTSMVIKNNLFYNNWATTETSPTRSPIYFYPTGDSVALCGSNMGGDSDTTDPLFTNTTLCSVRPCVVASEVADFTLQAGSTAIDAATFLTQANGAGTNSATLIVDDATYFQDGTWGSDLARSATLVPDQIAVGTVGNVATISSINYTTNTITLSSTLTWADNANVWLYAKSDGTRVLYGTAPDYGAAENTGAAADTTAPTVTVPATDVSSSSAYTLAGTAADETALSSVTWSCPTCVVTSGTATGTTSWSAALQLASGTNAVTVTPHDSSGNTGSATSTISWIISTVGGLRRRR